MLGLVNKTLHGVKRLTLVHNILIIIIISFLLSFLPSFFPYLCVCLLAGCLVYLCVGLVIHWLVGCFHSFIFFSFIHIFSFIHLSFIHSFILSFVHCVLHSCVDENKE